MSKRILILHTGGTLGMRPRDPDEVLAPDEFGATVLEYVPELERIADIETRVLCSLDSSDISPDHWMDMVRAIFDARDECDGVVVTHGTDAMVYTASALSYVLRNPAFPVILTGSQRPLTDVHTDGRANLVGAVDLASRPVREVCIYFDGLLLRGNRAVKQSTFAFGAFSSPDYPPLAEVGTGVRMTGKSLPPWGNFEMKGGFDPRVAAVWLHPGDDGSTLRALAESDKKAVLLIAFGHGNIPTVDRRVAEATRAILDAGKVVAVGSQSPNGRVNLDRYAGGQLLKEMGAVGIGDMTLPAALVKLMYLTAVEDSPELVRRRMPVPIAGEITVRESKEGS